MFMYIWYMAYKIVNVILFTCMACGQSVLPSGHKLHSGIKQPRNEKAHLDARSQAKTSWECLCIHTYIYTYIYMGCACGYAHVMTMICFTIDCKRLQFSL